MARFRVGGRSASVPRLRCFKVLMTLTLIFIISVSYIILQPDFFSQGHDPDDLDEKPLKGDEVVIVNRIDFPPENAGVVGIEELIQQLVKKYRVDFSWSLKGDESAWSLAETWVTNQHVLPESTPELGAVLHAMATSPILSVDTGVRGTQLKLSMKLAGGQTVIFKPLWYERDYIVEGPPYAGRDRHNAEIAAFHLSRILNLRRTPLAVGRRVSLSRDVIPVASNQLINTFFQSENGETCFFGKCLYCNKANALCLPGDIMEGTVVLWLPPSVRLKLSKHPWRRTYKDNVMARWETDPFYCSKVRKVQPYYNNTERLLDLIDTAVFDFLIGNADRHHYETVKTEGVDRGMLVMLDNGKSFGNPHHDEHSILAPLYHCCSIRYATWATLVSMRGGVLSSVLREVMTSDPVTPVLNDLHLAALDRRLEAALQEVEKCITSNGLDSVIF